MGGAEGKHHLICLFKGFAIKGTWLLDHGLRGCTVVDSLVVWEVSGGQTDVVQAGPQEDSTGVTVEAFDFSKSYAKSHFQVARLTLCFSSPEVANGTVRSLPGATVTLLCPGKEAAGNVTIHWIYSGSQNRKWTTVGNTLVLRAVQLSDTGNYLCFLDDHLVGTVPLLVDGEL